MKFTSCKPVTQEEKEEEDGDDEALHCENLSLESFKTNTLC